MFEKSISILFSVFLFFIMPGIGQNLNIEISSYGKEQGLSGRFTRWIQEDSRGFIWISTDKGLNRFDGHDFKVFTKENSGLFLNYCQKTFEDPNGNIWVGFKNTGSVWISSWHSIITPDFKVVDTDEYFKGKMPFTADEIFIVGSTPDKSFFILTTSGAVYQYDGITFKKIGEDKKIGRSFFIQTDSTGRVFLDDEEKVSIIYPTGNIEFFERPNTSLYPIFYKNRLYWRFKEYAQDSQMFFENDTLPVFYKKIRPGFKDIIPKENTIRNFFFQEDLEKALVPENKLLYDKINLLTKHFSGIAIDLIIFTRKGSVLVSNFEGLHIVNFTENKFENFLLDEKAAISTRGILKTESDKFIIATYSGLAQLNSKTGDFQFLPSNDNWHFRQMLTTSSGDILLGSYSNRIHRYVFSKKQLEEILLVKKDLKNFFGKGFLIPFRDNSGKIWVGTSTGLVEYNSKLDSLELFKKYNGFDNLKEAQISHFEDFEEGIWIASSQGMFLLNPEKGIVANHLKDLHIEHFYREDSIVWLATYGNGLLKWNLKTNDREFFGIKNGLLNEHLMAVYPDKNGNLWVTSNEGLAQFNRKTGTFKVFLETDGINHKEFNIASHFQDEDGSLYFGGINGVTAFDPDDFTESNNEHPGNFVLTGYEEIDSETLELKDKTTTFLKEKIIRLPPDVQTFTLKFALLNFESVKNTRYAYKIEGLDKDWIFQKENYVKFSRLPYGNFSLRLKAIDYSGTESGEIVIPLKVIAPFYQQIGWQIFGVLLLTSLTYGIFRRRLYLSKLENQKLEQVVSERTEELETLNQTKDRLFAILAHDLRNPLIGFEKTASAINYLIRKGKPEELEKLGNFIEIEAKQMNQILDNLLHWAMAQRKELPIKFDKVNLSELIKSIAEEYQYLEKRTDIKILTETETDLVVFTDRRVLEVIFRNIITNAFRHTEKGGSITISGYSENRKIIIEFADTGEGMTEEELENLFTIKQRKARNRHSSTISLGMHLCRELAEQINGEISAKAQIEKGTLVTLKLDAGH